MPAQLQLDDQQPVEQPPELQDAGAVEMLDLQVCPPTFHTYTRTSPCPQTVPSNPVEAQTVPAIM